MGAASLPLEGPGLLVALEGLDGAGSSTQVAAVAESLRERGVPVLATREPSDGPVGTYVRRLLRHECDHESSPATLALLFAADRRDHVDRVIGPAVRAGKVVLSDRYLLSSLVYQGLETEDMSWVEALNRSAPRAHLTVLIDVPAALGAERRATRDMVERYEVGPFQARVRQAYLQQAQAHGAVVLDGRRSIEDLCQETVARIVSRLQSRNQGATR